MANVSNFLQYEFALNQSAINLATQIFFNVIYNFLPTLLNFNYNHHETLFKQLY